MSKRVGAIPEETRKWILNSATEEFYEKGYQDSSLRHICTNVGVTTGAVYFLFKNKEELFKTIVENVTNPIVTEFQAMAVNEKAQYENGEHDCIYNFLGMKFLIQSYLENPKIWFIMLKNLNHPVVHDFFAKIIEIGTNYYSDIIHEERIRLGYKTNDDRFEVEHFTRLQVYTILVLIGYQLNEEEIMKRLAVSVRMVKGSFLALIEDL